MRMDEEQLLFYFLFSADSFKLFLKFKHNKKEMPFIVCGLMVSISKVSVDPVLLPAFAGFHSWSGFPCVPGYC